MKFNVPDMSCGHCTAAIEKSIKAVDPIAQVSFDLGIRHVEVLSTLSETEIGTSIKDAGYDSSAVDQA
jgi:copper chaperone